MLKSYSWGSSFHNESAVVVWPEEEGNEAEGIHAALRKAMDRLIFIVHPDQKSKKPVPIFVPRYIN